MNNRVEIEERTRALFDVIQTNSDNNVSAQIVIRSLVQLGVDLSAKNGSGETPMQAVCKLNKWRFIDELARYGKVNEIDSCYFNEALVYAVNDNKKERAELLLRAGAKDSNAVIPERHSLLHLCIKHKNLAMLELLILFKANFAFRDKQSFTPIEYAASLGQWYYVEIIATKVKVDNDQADDYGFKVTLVNAVAKGKVKAAQCLLDAGAAGEGPGSLVTKNTCLRAAIAARNRPMIQLLIRSGADLAHIGQDKLTPAQYACTLSGPGRYDSILAIVETNKTDEQDTYQFGDALQKIAAAGNGGIVKSMLAAGVPVNARDSVSGNTALHWAVQVSNKEMFEDLKKAGAMLDVANLAGLTPGELACDLSRWDCLTSLLQGKTYQFKNITKVNNAFVSAVGVAQLAVADMLLQAGAVVDSHRESDGYTCLHVAVNSDLLFKFEYALKLGASLTATNKANQTPVELACLLGKTAFAQTLIEKSGHDDVVNHHFEKALECVIANGNYFLCNMLLERGAPCNRETPQLGNVMLSLAVVHYDACPKILPLLLERDRGINVHARNHEGKTIIDLLNSKEVNRPACLKLLKQYVVDQQKQAVTAAAAAAVSLPQLRKNASDWHRSLRLNAVPPNDISATVIKLRQCCQDILALDLKALQEAPVTEESDQAMAAINTLIYYPAIALQWINQNTPASSDIIFHLMVKHDIMQYEQLVLMQLRTLGSKINAAKWQIKNMLGKFVEGVPETIPKIKAKIDSACLNVADALKYHVEILELLNGMTDIQKRHPDTSKFYREALKELTSEQFAMMPATALPPPPSYASVCHAQQSAAPSVMPWSLLRSDVAALPPPPPYSARAESGSGEAGQSLEQQPASIYPVRSPY